MFWALISTVFIIYLYRKLNRGSAELQKTEADEPLEAELTALNEQIASLEAKLGCTKTENTHS